jgi:hypothetical protein
VLVRPNPIRTSSRPAHGALALALALALAGATAACGGSDGGSDAVTSLPASGERRGGTTTVAASSPEEQASAAYQEGQVYLSELLGARPPDPLDAGLQRYFSGEALAGSRDVVSALLSANEYAESAVTTNPHVVEASAGTVVLDDCLQEQVTRYDVTTGDQKTTGSASYNLHVTVLAADSAWKVDQIEIREDPCTP